MANNQEETSPIISYLELSIREHQQLQKGMNFRRDGRHSVFLMSSRTNAPYSDEWIEEKQLLIYEGHDASIDEKNKKKIDQPMYRPSGILTDNGKFFNEAISFKGGKRNNPLQIQVYEKLDVGVWFDKGVFDLVDAEYILHDGRKVFKFYLHPTDKANTLDSFQEYIHERMIPTLVKVEVWRRDHGKCTTCGATTGLHYDHILPFSRGGRSDDPRNIQILCARHNLQKSDRIV